MSTHRIAASNLTFVVDEGMLVDDLSIGDERIRILLEDALRSGNRAVARACCSALGLNDVSPGERRIARAGCAELWNERMRSEALGEQEAMAVVDPTGRSPAIHRDTGRTQAPPRAPSPLSLELTEFPCPICHLPIRAQDVRQILRVPWHRIGTPVFPFGYDGPMFRAECPASLMQITQVCGGQHDPPRCDDPQCLRGDDPDDDDPPIEPPPPLPPPPPHPATERA